MTEDINTDQCADPTQNFTVELPCRMVERIKQLDGFLRRVD